MKKLSIYLLALLGAAFYACEEVDDASLDTEAPVFTEVLRPRGEGASPVVKIRGEYMEPRSESSTHFHVEGTVTDNTGVARILMDVHSVFDGHSHGRLNLLPGLDIDAVLEANGAASFTFVESDFANEDYYYNDQNYAAGPYDVTLTAVDIQGNATSFGDGSSVVRHFYLRRPYQPLIVLEADPSEEVVELDFEPGAELSLEGWIQQNRGAGNLAFPVTFIRITIAEDEHGHEHRGGDEHYEGIWGASNYLTTGSGAPLSGRTLPVFTNDQLDFNTLFADVPYTLSEEDDHMVLMIEIEDAGGNVAIREFELEVHN